MMLVMDSKHQQGAAVGMRMCLKGVALFGLMTTECVSLISCTLISHQCLKSIGIMVLNDYHCFNICDDVFPQLEE
jgi:hypothetical protein